MQTPTDPTTPLPVGTRVQVLTDADDDGRFHYLAVGSFAEVVAPPSTPGGTYTVRGIRDDHAEVITQLVPAHMLARA